MAYPLLQLLTHPLAAFLVVWAAMLTLYDWHVLLFFEPGPTLWKVFALSLLSFMAGMILGALALPPIASRRPELPRASLHGRWLGLMWVASALVIARNVLVEGPPPLLTLTLVGATSYLEYGSFNAVWQATCLVTFALSSWADRWGRWGMRAIPAALFVLHLSRGWLIMALVLWAWIEVLRLDTGRAGAAPADTAAPTRRRRRAVLLLAASAAVIVLLMWVLGEVRTGGQTMMDVLLVSEHARPLGAMGAWLLAYVSGPIDNVVYWLDYGIGGLGGRASLAYLVPSFILAHFSDFSLADFQLLCRVPTNFAVSYLGAMVLDFGWYGVVLCNLLYGAIGQWAYRERGASWRGMVRHGFALTAIYMMFFAPWLLLFPYLLAWWLAGRCLRERRPRGAAAPVDAVVRPRVSTP